MADTFIKQINSRQIQEIIPWLPSLKVPPGDSRFQELSQGKLKVANYIKVYKYQGFSRICQDLSRCPPINIFFQLSSKGSTRKHKKAQKYLEATSPTMLDNLSVFLAI